MANENQAALIIDDGEVFRQRLRRAFRLRGGEAYKATALAAVNCGANDYRSKPVDADQIIAAFATGGPMDASGARLQPSVPSLGPVEWEHIQRVLTDSGCNVSQAAKRWGLHRRSCSASCRGIRRASRPVSYRILMLATLMVSPDCSPVT